jgi:hypothetical protein
MVQMIGDSNSSRGKILSLLHKVQPGSDSHQVLFNGYQGFLTGVRLTTHLVLEPIFPFFLHVFMACMGRTYLYILRFMFIDLIRIWFSLMIFQFKTNL